MAELVGLFPPDAVVVFELTQQQEIAGGVGQDADVDVGGQS